MTDATLRVATAGEPPTIDYHYSTASLTHVIGWHIYETLLTLDSDYAPQPMLADTWEVSDDGLTYTFTLRAGVLFHNGQELKAADVVASLNRWGKLASAGKTLFTKVSSLEAPDDSTVVFELSEPFGSLPSYIAGYTQAPAVMPADIAEQAGEEKLTEDFIGTGPYQFVEWQTDVHVKVTRFGDYQPRPEPYDGVAGARQAIIKDVFFIPQPDVSARASGLLAGDYDFAMNLVADQYQDLESRSDITTQLLKPYYFPVLVFNQKEPPCGDLKFRQAVVAALDFEAVMSPLGPQDFWRLDPSYMPFGRWHSASGGEFYNQKNPDKAKQLLAESSYSGEQLTYMSTRQYDFIDKPAQIIVQQMQAIGINVNLEVLDWATLVSRRGEEQGWHFFTTGWTMLNDPTLYPFLSCAGNWPGFYCNPDTDALLDEFQQKPDFEGQYEVWEQIQAQFWSDCQVVKTGDYFGLYAMRDGVGGWNGFIDLFVVNMHKG